VQFPINLPFQLPYCARKRVRFRRLNCDDVWILSLRKCLLTQDPNTLIRWYNDVVNWLASIATHPKLQDLSWPVREFSTENDGIIFPLPPSALFMLLNRFWVHDVIQYNIARHLLPGVEKITVRARMIFPNLPYSYLFGISDHLHCASFLNVHSAFLCMIDVK
jgi:MCM3AP domain of GANP